MIQSIALQNFQSHVSSQLEFDAGVNVIVGDSDSGKTAILRALNWVLTNRPTGEAFRRNGSDITKVAIVISDGVADGTITRSRSDRENLYYGTHCGKLAAIGTSVPESVSKLLKMNPDVNLQRQLDAPFLLSCSAGEVAQQLNEVVGLDEIDVALANASKRVRQSQGSYEEAVSRHDRLSEQVDSFAYVEQMNEDVQRLEECFQKLQDAQATVIGLTELRDNILVDQRSLASLPDVDHAWETISQCEELTQNYNSMSGVICDLSECVSAIRQTSQLIGELLDVSVLLEKTQAADQLLKELTVAQDERILGRLLVTAIATQQEDLQKVSEELFQSEVRFSKEMPAQCPLCGRKGRK